MRQMDRQTGTLGMPSQNLLETQQETFQASDVLQDCQTEPEKQLSVQTGAKPTLFK